MELGTTKFFYTIWPQNIFIFYSFIHLFIYSFIHSVSHFYYVFIQLIYVQVPTLCYSVF